MSNENNIGDKAIVKETGESHNVIGEWKVFSMTIELPIELESSVEDSVFVYGNTTSIDVTPGDKVKLDNGVTYNADEVVVGKEEIRKYKLSKLDEDEKSKS